MKSLYPEDYAKIRAYQGQSNSIVSGLIRDLRKKNLLPTGAVTALVPAKMLTRPTLQEIQQTVSFLLSNLPSLAKGFDKRLIEEKYPLLWQKIHAYYGDKKASLYTVFSTHRNRLKKLKNSELITTSVREPQPETPAMPALNFCPHCAFPIGSVIKAVNAMSALVR